MPDANDTPVATEAERWAFRLVEMRATRAAAGRRVARHAQLSVMIPGFDCWDFADDSRLLINDTAMSTVPQIGVRS